MAENINKAAYIKLSELDLSGRSPRQPTGVPAGVIGTSLRGPAFIPVTVPDLTSFVSYFGNVDGDHPGTVAMYEWLQNAEAGTFLRVLGVGDGKRRAQEGTNKGRVNRAGYVVGAEQVQSNGRIGSNPHGSLEQEGRTWFLGALMSGPSLVKAGLQNTEDDPAHPIIRAIIHTPSGVALQLYREPEDDMSSATAGFIGDVDVSNGDDRVWLKLDGFVSDTEPNEFFFSLQSNSTRNPLNVLNTDPTLIEKKGHYLQSFYDVADATVTGSLVTVPGIARATGVQVEACTAFVVSGSSSWNDGALAEEGFIGIPNYESYETRFSAAFTPWITSQKFGNAKKKLFRFHALDDGANGGNLRVEIKNISYPTVEGEWGKFVVEVQSLFDVDGKKRVHESFNVDLNPNSLNFIGRVIGDAHIYYDFDKNAESQKLVVDGYYPNTSRLVRVEIDESVYDGVIEKETLPMGFEGVHHMVTAGAFDESTGLLGGALLAESFVEEHFVSDQQDFIKRAVQPPFPLVNRASLGAAPLETVNADASWGFAYSTLGTSSTQQSRKSIYESSIKSFLSFQPNFHTEYQNPWVGDNAGTQDVGGSILDSSRFNNNGFSLEQVAIVVKSPRNLPFSEELAAARYSRTGALPSALQSSKKQNEIYDQTPNAAGLNIRFLRPTDLKSPTDVAALGKFVVPMQGGFDGLNIYDVEKSKLTNTAALREFDDAAEQGGVEGSTIASFRKAIQVMEGKNDVDIKLLAIPGIRHESITAYAIDAVERRFDAMYIMDIEESDKYGNPITGSDAEISTTLTVASHLNKNYDSSFAAAYFPDTYQRLPGGTTVAKCPPSVAVLGAMAFNDKQAPWFAPAGFNRGILQRTDRTAISFNTLNLDDLYAARINPIATFTNAQTSGTKTIAVYGQKTLQQAESALDRVNVRRLLIEVRRQVRGIANSLLFEPNREDTLARFQAAVIPILSRIQSGQGLDRFKVQIDTSTTTQADIENNTIRGKIFLQPTKTTEFISLTFEVGNSLS